MNNITRFIMIALALIITAASYADVKLPAVIADNMVLQQKTKAPIWGWADPGEKIEVKGNWSWFASAKTKADADGKWSVKIGTPKAGGPYTLSVKGKNTIELKNILMGEVWVCSGQSNMEWPMTRTQYPKKDIAAAKYPNIRLFTVKRKVADKPKKNCKGNWAQCSPETVKNFSAVGYFFGKHLHDKLDTPIGLISTNWGGTPAEAWTRKEILENDEDLAPIVKRFNPAKRNQNSPASLYNGMIAPIIPLAIKGAIWYQGESHVSVSRAHQYRKLFPAMITNWRDDWGQGDFPFYYVQIAPYNYNKATYRSQELREAQMMTLALKNTGMAVTMDIGNPRDLHPRNKLDVGKRLALWALAKNYGKKNLVYSGPLYKSMKVEGDKIRLSFDHVGSGLAARDGKELAYFRIAGEDKKFAAAKAVIDGDTILVSSDKIKNPVAVRYGWENAAMPNLANKEGLPASSFRTDDWPGKSFGKK